MAKMDKGLNVPIWVLINRLKIPQMPQNLSAQIVCPSPKVWDFDEKRLHWASVVRAPSNFFQDAFRENLSYIKWMSPASADAARAKLEHMADLIGFPNFVLNSTWLDQGMCYYQRAFR